jgi:hypothetical protein
MKIEIYSIFSYFSHKNRYFIKMASFGGKILDKQTLFLFQLIKAFDSSPNSLIEKGSMLGKLKKNGRPLSPKG